MEDASSEEAVFSDIQQEGGDSFVFVEKFDDVVSVEGSVAGESPFFFPSTIKPLADSGAFGEQEWHHQAAKSYVSNFHHPEERELVEDLLLSVDKFSEETDVVKLSTESDWKRLRSFIAQVVKAREKLNEAITRASLGSSDPLAAEEVTEKVWLITSYSRHLVVTKEEQVIKKVIKNATQRLEAVETKRGYLRVRHLPVAQSLPQPPQLTSLGANRCCLIESFPFTKLRATKKKIYAFLSASTTGEHSH